MTLNFSKLYHKTALCSQTGIDVPGVYIWGFIYEKEEGKIGNPVDFTRDTNPEGNPEKHVFIPYYVGIARNNMTVLSRLSSHLQFRANDSSKRTRIKISEIPSTLSNCDFPLNPRGRDQNRISNNTTRFLNYIQSKNYQNDISYFNDANILKIIYNNAIALHPQKTNYPIQLQALIPNRLIPDSLNTLASSTPCISTNQCYNNFFFCFLEHKIENTVFNPINLALIEAVCVLMLKGKTLGQFQNLHAALHLIADPDFLIIDDTGFNIFKAPASIRIDDTLPFELGNIAFPGYLQP